MLPNRHNRAPQIAYAHWFISIMGRGDTPVLGYGFPEISICAGLQEEHVCNVRMFEVKRDLLKRIVQGHGPTTAESQSETIF
jgi:hypothetical protein